MVAYSNDALPPPQETWLYPSEQYERDLEDLEPIDLFFKYSKVTAADVSGKSNVKLKITGVVRRGESQLAQLVNVQVVGCDPSLRRAQSLRVGQKLVAKLYDPFYDNWYARHDPFSTADSQYAHEVNAYSHLRDLYGTHIPRFHGSYNAAVSVPDTGKTRFVRMILMEPIFGSSLSTLDEGNYTQTQRQEIIKQVIEANTELFLRDLAHRDIHPRNVMLRQASKVDIRLVDFGQAKYGWPSNNGRTQRLRQARNKEIRRYWTMEGDQRNWNHGVLIDFNHWIDWNWMQWLTEEFPYSE